MYLNVTYIFPMSHAKHDLSHAPNMRHYSLVDSHPIKIRPLHTAANIHALQVRNEIARDVRGQFYFICCDFGLPGQAMGNTGLYIHPSPPHISYTD